MSNVVRKIVRTALAPKPVGPYNQAVIVDKTIYVSGQIGMVADGSLVPGGIEPETEQTLKNLKGVLQGAGVDLSHVIKVMILLDDISDWPKVNSIYEKYFIENAPARSAFAVAALPKGAKVEIEAVAVLGDIVDAN